MDEIYEDELRNLGEVVRSEIVSRISELKWRTLFEDMQESYLLCRMVRDATGMVLDFVVEEGNSTAAAIYGLQRDEQISTTWPDSDVLDHLLPALAAAVGGGQSQAFEDVVRRSELSWMEVRVKDTRQGHRARSGVCDLR